MKAYLKYTPWLLLAAMVIGMVIVLRFVTPMLAVGSGSMEPTLPTHSRIIIHEQSAYKVGDIITFHTDGNEVVTHRLVKYANDGSLVTKGDANPTPDAWDNPVTKSDVMGKVIFMTPITTLAFWTTFRGIGIILCLVVIGAVLLWRVKDESTEAGKHTATYTPA